MYRDRITILYDNTTSKKGSPIRRLPSQEDTVSEARAVEEALSEFGFKVRRLEIMYERIEMLIQELLHCRDEIIFNLCEDIKGEGIYEVYVASLLELLGMDYTGSGPMTLGTCLDKAKAQTLLSAHALPTPRHVVLGGTDEALPKTVHFPLIVKLLHEDGSLGLDKRSVVYDRGALKERVKRTVRAYHQPVMAEEYIDGREFNVAVLGNGENAKVLPISEIDYSTIAGKEPKILTYASKWDESSSEYRKMMPVCPASLSPSLEKTLRTLALTACRILGCRDYTRVDFRLKGKTPFIIEVNPNPCISLDAGFVRSAKVAGYSYAGLVKKIVEFAIARKGARVRQVNQWLKEAS